MKTKILHSFGKRDLVELDWDLPPLKPHEVRVGTIFAGICSSDVAMYAGKTDPLPVGIFGHEGLGVVVDKGSAVDEIIIGQYVATRGDPAFGYVFNCDINDLVKVPEADPKYIIEPVACAVNISAQALDLVEDSTEETLLVGTGCLALVVAQHFKAARCPLTVVGRSLRHIWNRYAEDNSNLTIVDSLDDLVNSKKTYGSVIELSGKPENFDIISKYLLNPNGTLFFGSTPSSPVTTNFFENSWKAHRIIFPSPRTPGFKRVMEACVEAIQSGELSTTELWTNEYNRKDIQSCVAGFEAGLSKKPEFVRAYINFSGE